MTTDLLRYGSKMTNLIEWFARLRGTKQKGGYAPSQVAAAIYRGLLDREADSRGMAQVVKNLDAGQPIEEVIRGFVDSGEFQMRALNSIIPARKRPDLRKIIPSHYTTETTESGETVLVFKADDIADFGTLENLISLHGYYDQPGVWGSKIDLDKQIIAAIVRGLGAKSCLEIGCFTGSVLSLLEQQGLDVCGIDASHLAFVLAYPNIRTRLKFGDLLSIELDRTYDCVLAMDILEHLNPAKLSAYIKRISSLLGEGGFALIESPMYGTDDVFGTVFPPYLKEWQSVGDTAYWRHLHCDEQGWPLHGHLVWASPQWWERAFLDHGLVRDREIEASIQDVLKEFFETAPARKGLFVLRPEGDGSPSAPVARSVQNALERVEGLPR